MTSTINIPVCVEPEVKSRAEQVLDALGLDMASAVGIFLRQVVIHNGLPFAMRIPNPTCIRALTDAELADEILKDFTDAETECVRSTDAVFDEVSREFKS